MYYILFYEYVENAVAKRAPLRSAHLQAAEAMRDKGILILAGAYADPVDGAALIFQTHERSVVEDFAKTDPYVTAGLVTRWWIREWTVVVAADPRAVPTTVSR